MNIDIGLLVTAGLCLSIGLVTGLALAFAGNRRTRAALEQELNRARGELQRKREDFDQLSERHQAAEQQANSREVRLGVLKSGVANLGRQAADKDREIDELRDRLEALGSRFNKLENQHVELQTRQEERTNQHREQLALLESSKQQLTREFENLANRIFDNRSKHFNASSRETLEGLLQPFREQISGFQARINEVHSESLKGHSSLAAEIRKVSEIGLEMNSQAGNLASALKGDKKTTGNWGEAQLQRTLELAGLQEGEHYQAQAAFRDGEGKVKLPDFVVNLPDGKSLVIDSKVSLVDYDRAISAASDPLQQEALNAHAQAVKNHIDDLSAKDYSHLPNMDSPDFVLMFMPVEPAYIEAMKHNRDLFNHGYEKGVIMVSHTTLMPILRTVSNLWMIDRSHREAREIASRAGDIYAQVCNVADRLQKLGNSLKAAGNHYNDTVKSLVGKQGLQGKLERFQQFSPRGGKELVTLEAIHSDIDADRLANIARSPASDEQQGRATTASVEPEDRARDKE